MENPLTGNDNRWPHRVAVVLCCATFPLIWVGGLVTTYDAGMAVPDWPSTFGYNLFAYPLTTWLGGPWDLFIEHGHRLLGALVGLLTIVLVVACWTDPRRWVRRLAVAALGLVILQGMLGGARVLLDDRQLAMVHGCLGPGFFAFCVGLAACTSADWRSPTRARQHACSARLRRLTLLTAGLAYLQLIVGAQLRHVPVTATPAAFQMLVAFHVTLAAVLLLQVTWLAVTVFVHRDDLPRLRMPTALLACLILFQMMLGPASWIVKYGWPHWFGGFTIAAGHVVRAKSFWQATIVTAHVACGSLILASSVLVMLRSFRFLRAEKTVLGSGALMMGIVP